MTEKDVLEFCDKGNHKYREADVLTTVRDAPRIGEETKPMYILFQCDACPSKWVKRI